MKGWYMGTNTKIKYKFEYEKCYKRGSLNYSEKNETIINTEIIWAAHGDLALC